MCRVRIHSSKYKGIAIHQGDEMHAQQLILGGDSKLGIQISKKLDGLHIDYESTTRNQAKVGKKVHFLDLANPTLDIDFPKFDVVYFLAGNTSISECSKEKDETFRLNVTNTIALVRLLEATGSRIIFPSSNHVFSGRQSRAAIGSTDNPQSEYGRQKKIVESELLKPPGTHSVVRLGKIVWRKYPLFETWKNSILSNQEVTIHANKYISPITLEAATTLMVKLANSTHSGLYQLSAPDDISYLDVFNLLAGALNAAPYKKILFHRESTSPTYSSMEESSMVTQLIGTSPASKSLLTSLFAEI